MQHSDHTGRNKAYRPLEEKDKFYNMNHKNRGLALIFNHEYFETQSKRTGTQIDKDRLKRVLEKLGFNVEVNNDLTYSAIYNRLQEVAKMDHSNNDCLLITVLTHGELGMLYAKDIKYSIKKLWCHFTEQNCPSLAEKPKIFFIQACRGGKYDNGITLLLNDNDGQTEVLYNGITTLSDRDETNEPTALSENPTLPDFIFGFSGAPEYYTWRNDRNGTWFIQTLCDILLDYKTEPDLMKMLTYVGRKVAIDFQSNTPKQPESHRKKQVPSIHSTLTRQVIFEKKRTKRN